MDESNEPIILHLATAVASGFSRVYRPFMVRSALGPYLDGLSRTYGARFLHTDPIGEVRRFAAPEDREVAAFLAAGLAFGRVDLILTHLRDLWVRLDHAPARAADETPRKLRSRLRGFRHRWVGGDDAAAVLAALGRVRARHGSLGVWFLAGYDAQAPDLASALAGFLDGIRAELVLGRRRGPALTDLPQGVRTFFSDPRAGGACKRLNLYLRWMVRPDDGVDLGLWPGVSPAQLTVPLDTHVARISRYLGLSTRRTADWKMATEVTSGLARFDPRDPVRYDFALSRLGILDQCPRRVNPVKCGACPLVPVCTLGRSL